MRRQILRSSFLVATITACGIIAEMLKDVVVADRLGTTAEGDAFFAALTVPLLVIGALLQSTNISLVPLFSNAEAQKGEVEVRRLTNVLMSLGVPFLLLLSVAGVIAAPWSIRIVGAGFGDKTGGLAVALSRLLSPAVLLAGLASLFRSWLNSKRSYAAPAATNLVRSLGMIMVIWLFSRKWGTYAIAAGFVIGTLMQLVLVSGTAWRKKFRYSFSMTTDVQEVKKIISLLAWPLTTIFLRQTNVLAERMFASLLVVGGISALNYAYRMTSGLSRIFSTSVFTTVLPVVSSDAGREDWPRLRRRFLLTVRLVSLIVIPISVGIMALNLPLVTLIFQRGAFDARSVALTAAALVYYTLGLPLMALIPLFNMLFYAVLDVRTPVLIAVGATFANVLLDFVLGKAMGLNGLALGYSLARGFEILVTYVYLRRRFGQILERTLLPFYGKIGLASALMGGGVYVARLQLGIYLNSTLIHQVLLLSACGLLGLLIFVISLATLRVAEFESILRSFQKKLLTWRLDF